MQPNGLSEERISQPASYTGKELKYTDDKGIYRRVFIGESDLEPGHYVIDISSKWPGEEGLHEERVGLTQPAMSMLVTVLLEFLADSKKDVFAWLDAKKNSDDNQSGS